GVVITAPAGLLRALDGDVGSGIHRVHRLRPDLESPREGHVHPFLEVGPRGEVLVRAPHGFGRAVGRDRLPAFEGAAPLPVEGGQRPVPCSQPGPEARQRIGRIVEVPERGEIGNAGLVPQIVEEGAISGACPLFRCTTAPAVTPSFFRVAFLSVSGSFDLQEESRMSVVYGLDHCGSWYGQGYLRVFHV